MRSALSRAQVLLVSAGIEQFSQDEARASRCLLIASPCRLSSSWASGNSAMVSADDGRSGQAPMLTQEQVDARVAEARAAGAAAERMRIKAIMESEHVKGRETLAAHFAFETDASSSEAASTMKAAAPQAAPAPSETIAGEREPPKMTDAQAFAEGNATAKRLLGK